MNLQRVLAVALKEFREVVRDRILLLMTFLMPPMMMLVFAYGMSQDVENVPFVIVDYDHTPMSRDYAYRFIASRYFKFRGYALSEREAQRRMAHGDIRCILVIPERFQERLLANQPAPVQSLLDGTFTLPSLTVRGYIEAVSSEASAEIQTEALARSAGISTERAQQMSQPLDIEVRYLYNQEMRAAWTITPLLLMIILIWTTPLLMALSVVREKETGAIYNMYASTLSRAEYLIGKLLPNVAFSFINAILLFLLATRYYGAPFRGNLSVFALASLFYVAGISCLGLLISLIARVQQAALIMTIIIASIIMNQYSGINVSIADMTGPNYVMAHLFPPMYYTEVIQSSFLKGGGLKELWPDVLALAVCALAMFGIVLGLFRKRVPT